MQGNSHRFPGAGLGRPLFCLPDRLALLWKSWSLRFCDWPSGMQRVSGRAGTPAQGCRAPKLSEAKGMRLATVGTAQSPSAPGAGIGRRGAHFCLSRPSSNSWETRDTGQTPFTAFSFLVSKVLERLEQLISTCLSAWTVRGPDSGPVVAWCGGAGLRRAASLNGAARQQAQRFFCQAPGPTSPSPCC